MLRKLCLLSIALLLPNPTVMAWYPRSTEESLLTDPKTTSVIGSHRHYLISGNDTLIQLARATGLGYSNLINANPHVDPWRPTQGQSVLLPYAVLLDRGLEAGITINLAEMRLFLVWVEGGRWRVRIYPIGVGTTDFNTPEGLFRILNKTEKPTWNVPDTVRAEKPDLPEFVPPGPDNPLGDYWMSFTQEGHGLHGTNEPYGIGRRVSHGCIRLYPTDIADLYGKVNIGTPVRVVYRPAKVGISGDRLMLEIYPDYLKRFNRQQTILEIEKEVKKLNWPAPIDRQALRHCLDDRRGVPLPISQRLKVAKQRPVSVD